MLVDIITGFFTVSFDGFIALFHEHQILTSALIPFFAGEYSIHLFGMLYGSGAISLMPTVIAAGSILLFDFVIYGTVRVLQRYTNISTRLRNISFFAKIETFFKKSQGRYGKNPVLLFIAIKLMPMTKVSLIFFTLYRKVSVAWFIVWDVIISVIWVVIIFLPGWFVGKEFLTQEAGQRVTGIVVYFLLLVVLLTLFGDAVDKLVMRALAKIARVSSRRNN
ncbi:MAG: hypothetical protein OXB96_02110 [Candidatus Kaiserbacteria bacterium]|nr:hypothetical protein [Candidatus Kaiserbacteria bacterium]